MSVVLQNILYSFASLEQMTFYILTFLYFSLQKDSWGQISWGCQTNGALIKHLKAVALSTVPRLIVAVTVMKLVFLGLSRVHENNVFNLVE